MFNKCFIILLMFMFIPNAYAFRVGKPVPLSEVDKEDLVELNQVLEEYWNILNGRYNMDVVTEIPIEDATEGDFRAYTSSDVNRLYVFVNGSWRSLDFNDWDLVDASANNIVDASSNQLVVY